MKSLKQITIVGLGLMGASLAEAVCRKYPKARIVGVSRSLSARKFCLKKKWIHEGTNKIANAVGDADLVILCTPVDTFPKLLKEIDCFGKQGVHVTDVGSVKANITKEINRKKWKNIQFVSAHPMVGSHERGAQSAIKGLYDEGYSFVIKSKGASKESYAFVKKFWNKICRKVVDSTVQEHDRFVSEISHLPHIVAMLLVLSTSKDSFPFAAKGFKEVTRVAKGSSSIWLPIIQTNQKSIMKSLKSFERQVQAFSKACSKSDTKTIRKMLDIAAKNRASI